MSIISLFVWLALLGLIVWAITSLIPMAAGIKKIIYVAAVVIAVLIALRAFGLLSGGLGNVPQIQ